MKNIRDTFRDAGLVRSSSGFRIGGVISGIGRRLGLGPWISRLLFVLVLALVPGCSFVIYPILWILMPSESQVAGTQNPGTQNPNSPLQT